MKAKVKRNIFWEKGGADFSPDSSVIAIDTETTGVDVWGPRHIDFLGGTYNVTDAVFMVAMADLDGNTWCCDWPVDPFTRIPQVDWQDVAFIEWVLSKTSSIVFHNSKFDIKSLSNLSRVIGDMLFKKLEQKKIHDTFFEARICNTLELTYGLKPLSKRYLGVSDDDEKSLQAGVVAARRKLLQYNNAERREAERHHRMPKYMLRGEEVEEDYWLPKYFDPKNTLCEKYCRFDVYRTILLHQFYQNIISKDTHYADTYNEEMYDIWPIIDSIEDRGMRLFPDILKEESNRCQDAIVKHLAAMETIIRQEGLAPFDDIEGERIDEKDGRTYYKLKGKKAEELFNPGSSKQILRLLYNPKYTGGLGIPVIYARKANAKGEKNPTADKDALRELMYIDFVKELVGFRDAAHTKSLFFDKMPLYAKQETNKHHVYPVIHPGLNQCGTKTGRLSANSPNFQQMSAGGKKSLGGGNYSSQKVFGPRPGYVWLGFDYSQQEARLFAFLAQVPVMLKAMETGEDLFKAMANRIWGGKDNPRSVKAVIQALDLFRQPANDLVREVWKKYGWSTEKAKKTRPDSNDVISIANSWLEFHNWDIVYAEKSVDKESARQRCKHITYAKIFGGGPGSYTHLIYATLAEAKEFDIEYNESMPEIKSFMRAVQAQAEKDGYILNLYGRKLRVDRNFAYRGVSYTIQGSAAGMMKRSLVSVHEYNQSIKADAHIILTIHDEIKIEIAKKDYNIGYVRAVASRMEQAGEEIGLRIPVECTLCTSNWSVDEKKIEIWN